MRVLIVDDEPVLREMLRDLLELDGWKVDTASSAEVALELLEDTAYDLVMTDNIMPGMRGLELLERMQVRWPHIPVMIMTAYGSLEVSMRAYDLGAKGYLLKPFEDLSVVQDEVTKVMRQARQRKSHPK